MQMINDALGLIRRYGPVVMAHLLFFVALGLFAIERKDLPPGASIWAGLLAKIDANLAAVGLSLERWYVIAALLLVYLTAFEWLRGFLSAFPLLRIIYRPRFAPSLLAYACATLGLEPNVRVVTDALSALIERAREQVRQKNEADPYQWMVDREQKLRNDYGTLLIALVAVLIWAAYGHPYAKSADVVWITALLLAVSAVVLRAYIKRYHNRRLNRSGAWALAVVEQEHGGADRRLRRELRRVAERRAEQQLAARRHPAMLLGRLLRILPGRWRHALAHRIQRPALDRGDDWRLVASSSKRFADEAPVEVSALDARPFAPRFTSLLERKGTGLFILVPHMSGLALGANRAGSSFAFAERSHDARGFGLQLLARDSLDQQSQPKLRIETGSARGFIAEAGCHPLEKLLSGDSPDHRPGWMSVIRPTLDSSWLLAHNSADRVDVEGVQVGRAVDLKPGASYLLGMVGAAGTVATVAIQCYRIEGSERLLIAWGFLDVQTKQDSHPKPLPWWKPAAWKGLIRPPPRVRARSWQV